MKYLFRVHYRMQLQGGGDIWRVCGFDESDKIRWLSTPVEFDENADILKTVSGSVYKVMTYEVDKQKFVEQIRKDLLAGSYEVH